MIPLPFRHDPKGLAPLSLSLFLSLVAFRVPALGGLSLFCLVPLLRLVKRPMESASAFRISLLFGSLHFFGILWWLAPTIRTFGGLPLPVAVVVVALLAVYLGLYPALFFVFANKLRDVRARLVLLPAAWVALEFLRGSLFSGFPWALFGHSLTAHPRAIQMVDVGGVYLASFGIVLVNVWLADLEKSRIRAGVLAGLPVLLFWSGALFYGNHRIDDIAQLSKAAPTLRVSALQGNIPPTLKWDAAFREETLAVYETLSRKAAKEKAALMVWPETATPFYLLAEPDATRVVQTLVRESDTPHLIGSPAASRRPGSRAIEFQNASYLMLESGMPAGRYDKIHLVPFGEYVPFGKYLPFLEKIVTPNGSFVPGLRPPVLTQGPAPIAPLICFESVFPGLAGKAVRAGASILAVQTNDGWFGNTPGPLQHFLQSRFRAIETRRSVVRSANTGISALILPTGQVLSAAPLFARQTVTGDLPLLATKTFYVRHGDLFAKACLVVLLISGFAITLRERRESSRNIDTNQGENHVG